MKEFNAKEVKEELVQWLQNWFAENGEGCNAVVGISGGIDSSTVAALCVEALGRENVVGVLMPNGKQHDINYSRMLVDTLGIKSVEVDISMAVRNIEWRILDELGSISSQTTINLPPRIRMATLYAVSQSMNGRVMNTCNFSESYVGFDTRWADSVGDVSPLANLTKTEVRLLAKELGLPNELVNKTPEDGLTGKSDEDNFGFTYDTLDRYIRTGAIDDEQAKIKIDEMHRKNLFKLQPMPTFPYEN